MAECERCRTPLTSKNSSSRPELCSRCCYIRQRQDRGISERESSIPPESVNESNVYIKSASYRTAIGASLLPVGNPRRKSKYPALRRITSVIRGYAVILGLATSAVFVLLLIRSEYYQALLFLTFGLLVYFSLSAFAEMINVFIDIELNTRIIRNHLTEEDGRVD